MMARRPRALRVLSFATALVMIVAGLALVVGLVATDAPDRLRMTAGVVVLLLAAYRAALAVAPHDR